MVPLSEGLTWEVGKFSLKKQQTYDLAAGNTQHGFSIVNSIRTANQRPHHNYLLL